MATWAELMDLARDQLSDPGKTTWTDQELIRYFGYAQKKACRWGYLLRSKETVTINATDQEYSFPTGAIYILRMIWGGSTEPMEVRSTEFMDRRKRGWDQGEQTGEPRIWVQDQETKKFTIWRKPDADAITESATLTMTCVMLPAAAPTEDEFADNSTTPEIEAEHHEDLVDYVCFRANRKPSIANGRKLSQEDFALFKANMEMAKRERNQQNVGESTPFPRVV